MYFPCGWPRVLHSDGEYGGNPVKVFKHRTKDLVVELRESSIAFWHARVSLDITLYYDYLQRLDVGQHSQYPVSVCPAHDAHAHAQIEYARKLNMHVYKN